MFRFFKQLVFGYEEGKIRFLVLSIEKRPKHIVRQFSQGEAKGKPYIQPFDRVSHVHDFRIDEQLVEPLAEIVALHSTTPMQLRESEYGLVTKDVICRGSSVTCP